MDEVKAFGPDHAIAENLAMARRASDIGDVSHTVLHAQAAVCLSVEALAREIAMLRRLLYERSAPKPGALEDAR